MIHPTALIDPSAIIGANVSIGAYSVIGAEVEIGDGTQIGPHVVIEGPTKIGRDNRITQFASLGGAPSLRRNRSALPPTTPRQIRPSRANSMAWTRAMRGRLAPCTFRMVAS